MAETKFIKTTAFCGYDKADVDKKLEFLYGLVYDLKNELRETKLMLKDYQKGTDAEKNFETILASERTQLTQFQVKSEGLSEKNKSLKEELRIKEAEIAELHKNIETLQKKLSESELIISSIDKSSSEAYTIIFSEAQKSHDNIISSAQEKADALMEDAKNFAENFIIDSNNKASKIIYTSEKQAVDIITDAKNQAEQIKASANNFRFIMHTEVSEIAAKFSELRGLISDFSSNSLISLNDAEEVLDSTDKTLQNGGIPVFTVPKRFEPEYPDEPVYQSLKPAVPEKKNNDALDKLQAMAESISGGNKPEKSSGISLGDLAKQAESLESEKKVSDAPAESSKKAETKKGGMSLADLMKQAGSLND